MPRIEAILEHLGAANVVSTLDLTRGYWQVPVAVEDQQKTAFTTPSGLYQFTTMPFGLQGAGATFQRLANNVLHGADEYASGYMDDIGVSSMEWSAHLAHLRDVLTRLRNAGLTARPTKCRFGTTETPHLGHVVGGAFVRPSPTKTAAIEAMPHPSS